MNTYLFYRVPGVRNRPARKKVAQAITPTPDASTGVAFAMGFKGRAEGSGTKAFDWDKAAALIAKHKPKEAVAGLDSDWGATAGVIFRKGRRVLNEYTYLASTWATPAIELDGKRYACWTTESNWDAHTKWPASASRILKGAK